MKLEDLKEFLEQADHGDAVLFENPSYIDAVIGYDDATGRVIYSYDLMIESLMTEEKMSQEDAMDFISYNTLRALPYAGEMAPIVMYDLKKMLD